MLSRVLTHRGIKVALEKVRRRTVDVSVEDFLRSPTAALGGTISTPAFARRVAIAFLDAQTKRHEADYDLNAPLSEADARLPRLRVERAIEEWRHSRSDSDRDFKHALCMLMLLKRRLRSEN